MVIKFHTDDDDFDDLTGGVIASSFTHKIPIKVEDANGCLLYTSDAADE